MGTRFDSRKTSFKPFDGRDALSLISKLNMMRRNNRDLNSLFARLEDRGDIILIGGAIRDIIIFKQEPRDFDLIVLSNDENFDSILNGFSFEKNNFGGYRLRIGKYKFDVWSIVNHWAFKKSIFDCKIENLRNSIFFNFDAIFVNLRTGEYEAEIFNRVLDEKRLDIILDEDGVGINPYPEINIIKAFVIRHRFHLDFSDKLKHYIKGWHASSNGSYSLLQTAMKKHYGDDCLLKDKEIQREVMALLDQMEAEGSRGVYCGEPGRTA